MIGVYTDLKVKTLLSGLRMLYNLPNLAVSDSLTASAALERHLSGLDFAGRCSASRSSTASTTSSASSAAAASSRTSKVVATDSFSRYQSFFQDQQNVLAYEIAAAAGVHDAHRAPVARRVRDGERANRFLLVWGATFLTATLVLSIASAVSDVDWKLPAITAGVSLAQFLGAFFAQPTSDLQRNLTNLAAFRMILESHSLKTAFARLHLTTPHAPRAVHRARVDRGGPPARRVERARGHPGPRQIRLPEPARLDFGAAAAPAVAAEPAPVVTEEEPLVASNGDGAAPP